jgi:hypothetical protein
MTQAEFTFSEQMRSQTKAAWGAAIGHRFFREVANDTIDDRVFARYLKIEYGFVDCGRSGTKNLILYLRGPHQGRKEHSRGGKAQIDANWAGLDALTRAPAPRSV